MQMVSASYCKQPSAPVMNPSKLPGGSYYARFPWAYSAILTKAGICNFNFGLHHSWSWQTWKGNNYSAQFDMGSVWNVTANYDIVTTVTGKAPTSVPQSKTYTLNGYVYQGKVFPLHQIVSVECPITNGVATCPDGSTMSGP